MLGDFTYAYAIIAGLIVGILIGKITEVYTSADYKSVKKIAEQSQTGAATTIISGLRRRHDVHALADHLHRAQVSLSPISSPAFTVSRWLR